MVTSIPLSRFSKVLWVAAAVVIAVGLYWSFVRGAPDFRVFYEAGRLVLEGRSSEIYRESPDRFLYVPAFAWLMAPLSVLPFWLALTLWNALKLGLLIYFARAWGLGLAVAVLVWARPVLIDFQYGNINLILVLAAYLALGRSRWMIFGALASIKLLLIPFVSLALGNRERWKQVFWFVLGASLVLLLSSAHLQAWVGAIQSRGFPTETHNQSVLAFLHRFFSGQPVHVISLYASRDYTWIALSESTRQWIGVSWMIAWALSWFRLSFAPWANASGVGRALLFAMIIVPLHLVWKPYFVFAIPLVAEMVRQCRAQRRFVVFVAISGILVNFTSTSFIGHEYSARLEALSLMMWVHLAWIVWAIKSPSRASS